MIKLRMIFSLVAIAFLATAAIAAGNGPAEARSLQKYVTGKQTLVITPAQQQAVLKAKKVKVGGGLSFSCNAVFCACRGDADCNDMFSTSVCGPKAICIDNVCYCGRL